ncbi:MAG: hypothetical protein QG604_115 [Candidatus Dependentiae bacterium]|nr:hypothetical protein [Candidatus Dependentiae bacterium]
MMKKIISRLLLFTTFATPFDAIADVANKTFLAERGAISNNCLLSMSVNPIKNTSPDALDIDLSITGFFRRSREPEKLAQYFGDGTDTTRTGTIQIAPTGSATSALHGYDIDLISSDSVDDGAHAMNGIVYLNPRRWEAGAHIQWVQGLDSLLKGLWCTVAVPITVTSTNMGATYLSNPNTTSSAAKGAGKKIADFFSGSDLYKTSPAPQNPLNRHIITTTDTKRSAVGIADVKASLGYNVIETERLHVDCCLHAEMPTGNKASGLIMFEPLYGQRSFFAGAGLNSELVAWKSDTTTSSLELYACAKYTYCFAAHQTRTLALHNLTNGTLPQTQFVLVGEAETNETMPLANVSTVGVTIKPKSRIDAFTGLCFNYKQFTADIAYNLFYTPQEHLTLTNQWNDTKYGVVNTGVAEADLGDGALFVMADTDLITGGSIVASGTVAHPNSVDVGSASTPAQTVHKFGAGLGYRFLTKIPVRIGFGGDVDFSINNHALTSWAVWSKIGLCF